MQRKGENMPVVHPIPPVYSADSEILILGSFPSVKSREIGFFYGHPQNRFWKVIAGIFDDTVPNTTDEKKKFLLKHRIAVWDVIASCEITGSADSTIRDVIPNDLSPILRVCPAIRIFTNGKEADRMYRKYQEERTGITAVCLPSTSPANAQWSLDRLREAWRIIRKGK